MFEEFVSDAVECSDAELTARIEANELQRRKLDAEMSALLAVADSRSLNQASGHRTMTSWCRARLNWSTTETNRRRSMARAADAIPGMGDAWMVGRIGQPQAAKLAATHANPRVRDRVGEFAPTLLEHAEQMPYADFSDVVEHFVAQADEDGAHDDRDAAVEGRRARVVAVGDEVDVRATGGTGLETAEMVEIFHRFVDIEYRRDLDRVREQYGDDADAHPLPRTDRQRRFDALIAIFRSAASNEGLVSVGDPLVNINIDADTWGRMLIEAGLSAATSLDGEPIDPFTGLPATDADRLLADVDDATICRTTNGVSLHPHEVLRAAVAGHVRRVVFDSDRVVIDMGRRQRLFTGNARQAAKQLVRRCERSGCELPGDWCDVDHVEEWDRDDGRTDQANAAILCRHDNNDKHQRRWRTRRGANGCSYTIRADGAIEIPVGARPPRFPDELDDEDESHDSPADFARHTAIARDRVDQLLRTA